MGLRLKIVHKETGKSLRQHLSKGGFVKAHNLCYAVRKEPGDKISYAMTEAGNPILIIHQPSWHKDSYHEVYAILDAKDWECQIHD